MDAVLLATGYRPNLDYLRPLGVLREDGRPDQRGGIARSVPGLYFVGLPFQTSFASATLRGVGPDAALVVARARRHLARSVMEPTGASRPVTPPRRVRDVGPARRRAVLRGTSLDEPRCIAGRARSLLPRFNPTPLASRRLRSMTEKTRVLFLCTHNSAGSQMAEGLLRDLAGDRFEAMSAGTEATHVRPLAIRAMEEIGVDISGQESKTLDRYLGEPFDYVITVCDDANEACPFFPGAQSRLHWSFEDPSKAEGSEEERLAVFRWSGTGSGIGCKRSS